MRIEDDNVGATAPSDVLLGIDDTDNDSSPGTGYLAQQLLGELTASGLADRLGATRHQLLKDDRIPYTSHNSSACLVVRPRAGVDLGQIHDAAASFLREYSAPGSDPGLAVARAGEVAASLAEFGRRAKSQVLDQPTAYAAAREATVPLVGLGGSEDGVIGALAAVGLHSTGADGFYIWLDGIRKVRAGHWPVEEMYRQIPIADARTVDGRRPPAGQIIGVPPWVRPLLLGGRPVLLLEETPEWRVAGRDVVRQY